MDTRLPTPKFAIGDIIYVPHCQDGGEYLDCPDCLGAGAWPVVSPAGEAHEVSCPTCASLWGKGTGKLKFYRSEPVVRKLTVGSVRIDTAAKEGERVSYMCGETGIGSGNIYYEDRCCANEGDAMAFAQQLADEQTERVREKTKKQDALRVLPIAARQLSEYREASYGHQYALEDLKRKIIDLPEDGYCFSKSDTAFLREISLHLVAEEDELRAEDV